MSAYSVTRAKPPGRGGAAAASCRQRSGQAMIESVFVIILACLCFLAVFQFTNLFTSKAVLEHAAARAARTRTVGFNQFMVEKSARVAAIPASGKRLVPGPFNIDSGLTSTPDGKRKTVGDIWDDALKATGSSVGTTIEANRVPDYMDSINNPTAGHILDYELWDTLSIDIRESMNISGDNPSTLTVGVRQRYPLLISLESLFMGDLRNAEDGNHQERFSLGGLYTIENHYPLYMEDMNW